MENTVENLFPRGIPIPLTHTHTHTHLSLDYSFIHKYLVSTHSLPQPLCWGWGTRMNMPLWAVLSSTV